MKTKAQIKNSGLKNRSEQASTEGNGTANASASVERKDNRLPIDHDERRKNRTLPTSKVLYHMVNNSPELYRLAEVVGKWVWVQFQDIPTPEIRQQLAQLGFHWNRTRQAWQHPCGSYRQERSSVDPHQKYRSYFPADVQTA